MISSILVVGILAWSLAKLALQSISSILPALLFVYVIILFLQLFQCLIFSIKFIIVIIFNYRLRCDMARLHVVPMALVVEHTLFMGFQLGQSRHGGRFPLHSALLVVEVQTHHHQAYHEADDYGE